MIISALRISVTARSPAALSGAVIIACGMLAAAVAAVPAAHGAGLYMLVGLTCAAALALGLINWRWSILALLCYIPVSGIPNVVLYPNTGPAVLAKDVLFVLPAYAGFVAYAARRRWAIGFAGAPTIAIALLVPLVLVQAVNSHLDKPLVGLIGMKVWLFYLPLIYVGYHYVRSRRDLQVLLGVVSITALIPVLVGLVEAVLSYSGHSHTVYALYGSAAQAATQEFVKFDLGGASLQRLPSTFPYFVQYWQFTAAALAATYGWWRLVLAGTDRSWIGPVLMALVAVAGMTSGSRAAFIFLPLLLVIIVALDRVGPLHLLRLVVGALGCLLPALLILGIPFQPLADAILAQSRNIADIFTSGLHDIGRFGLAGLGAGIDSVGAKYAYANSMEAGVVFRPLGGVWYESWWLKTIIELGIVGLLVVLGLLATILRAASQAHVRLRDPRLRSVSSAFLGLLIWNLIYSFKSQYVDVDPMSIFFWLFAGILLKLRVLDRSPAPFGDDVDVASRGRGAAREERRRDLAERTQPSSDPATSLH